MPGLRKSGIDVLGEIPWGSHFCSFYETKRDLLDTLVPYFKAGLESKEFCMWVVSNSDLITIEEAKQALEQAVPNLNQHISEGNIEIFKENDWYLKESEFNLERMSKAWDTKLDRALALGYEGMRVSGDTFWLEENDWKDFNSYEKQLNDSIIGKSMTVLCTYSLSKSRAVEVLEVVHAHQFALARRQGEWEVVESPELIQAKAEVKKLNEELEQRVAERTRQLAKANNELRYQVAERKKAEDELRLAYQRLSYHFENTPLGVIELDKDLFIKRWSKRAEAIFGWKESEALGKNMNDADFPIIYKEDIRAVGTISEQLIKGVVNSNLSLNRNYTKGGKVIYCEWYNSILKDEQGNVITILSFVHNVTEKKITEEKITQSEAHLAEAQRLAKLGSWDFDIKTDKLTWSEELYNVFGTNKRTFRETHDSLLNLIDEEDKEFALQTSRHTQQTGEPFTIEYHITTPKGEKRIIQEHGYGQTDDNGKVVRLFGTAQDITERKKAEERLRQSYEEIRRLTEHLQKIREEERKSIAREIHDELGQQLTAIKMDIAWIDKKTPEDAIDIKRKLKNIIVLLDGSNQAIRRILSELRSQTLDDHGLLDAIEWLARQFSETTGIPVKFTIKGKEIKVPEQVATSIFRVCQEAFTNITRHALAKNVLVSINISEENILLIIEDDGIGFDTSSVQNKKSFGILGMKERVLSLGGKFELNSSPGNGTKIIVSLPYKS